jgi:hypothetical protein
MNPPNGAVCALGHIRDMLFPELFKVVAAPKFPSSGPIALGSFRTQLRGSHNVEITHVGICKPCQSH